MKKKHKVIWFFSIFLAVLLTSYGYAALNTELQLSGEAYVRIDADIRITDIKVLSSGNGGYATYNPDYSKDTTTMHVTLPNRNSSVTYEIELTNRTGKKIQVINIIKELSTNGNVSYTINNLNQYQVFDAAVIRFSVTVNNTSSLEQKGTLRLRYDIKEYQAPTVPALTGGSDKWAKGPKEIKLATKSTASSGIKEYEYYISTSNLKPSNSVAATGKTNNAVSVSKQDTSYTYYRAVANDGTKSGWSNGAILKLDNGGPTIKSVTYGNLSQNGYTVSVVAEDTLSGVSKYSYAVTGGNSVANSTSSTFKANKVANINITVSDAVGNSKTGSYQINAIDQYIAQLYRSFLLREASSAEIANWRASYNSSKNMLTVIKGIALSVEAAAKLSTNSSFIKGCYEGMFGRGGDANGVSLYVSHLNSGKSRDAVITTMSTSSSEYAIIKSIYGFQ